MYVSRGFTLAELLIALAILGVIATFTIPKVLLAQQNQQFSSSAKEVVSAVSAAYQAYSLNNGVSSNISFSTLTSSLNYVAVDTVSQVDDMQANGTVTCNNGSPCLIMHNGGMIRYNAGVTFAGTASTNALWFNFDPDGKVTDGTTNGPGKSIRFRIYTNGVVRTQGTLYPGTTDSGGVTGSPNPAWDPPWFSWN